MVTGGGQPGPFGINTAISRLQRTPRELIMKIGLLPDPCRTHWIRAFTALERAGSGVSWRQDALDRRPLRQDARTGSGIPLR